MNKAVTGQRFAVLARVSTKDQLTGYSLELQLKEARDYVQRAGGTVAKVYSGQESATRPEEERRVLQLLLADAERGLFDAVVIQEPTRLSRNMAVMASVTEKLVGAGIALHDFGGPLSIETPEGEFSASIQAVVGRFTARQSAAKSLKSREHLLKSGSIAAGRPPFGRTWRKEFKRFEIIPERAAQMKRAYDLIVRQGCSMCRTAAQLGMGESSLRAAITTSALTEVTQSLNGNTYRIPCPALLTEHQQRQLQACLTKNATVRPASKHEYLVQGLVRCAGCGGTMTGQSSTKSKAGDRHAIYRHPVPPTGQKLPEGCLYSVPVKLLDDDVLTACASIIEDGAALRTAIRTALTQADTGQAELAERVADVERRVAAAKKKLDQQLDTATEMEKGSEREAILQKVRRTGQTLTDLRAEHLELSSQLAVVELPKGGADAIAAQLRSLYFRRGAGAKAVLSFAQRKQFVRLMVGRNGRESQEGIFVQMVRPEGGSKKDVYWRYQLRGCIAIADGLLSADAETSYVPELRQVGAPSAGAVKQLAALAAASPGVHPRKSKFRAKHSSDDSRRCA